MQMRTAVRLFCEGYFSTNGRSPLTKKAYACDLDQFAQFVKPRTSITSVTASRVEKWSRKLMADGYSPSSIKRKLASLRVFFYYWLRRGRLTTSPMWQLRIGLGRTVQLPRCLTEGEMRLLLRAARRAAARELEDPPIERVGRSYFALRNLALLELLFATGIRVGEASALNLDDFCREDRSFRVRGKGGRYRLAFLADSETVETQLAYLAARKGLGVSAGALFLNSSGNRLSTQGMAYALQTLVADAAIARRVTPHMIRHTAATLLLRNGADLRMVQEFLGHASIVTTQRYTHVSKEHLISTLQRCHPARKLRNRSVKK